MTGPELRRAITAFGIGSFACVLLAVFAYNDVARACFGVAAVACLYVLTLLALDATRTAPTTRKHRTHG